MIGNDVVDLADDDSVVALHHPRFDSRVFSAEERRLLGRSAGGERLRWSMWASKESAFKLLRRHDPSLVFAPSRFVVRPSGRDAATVEAGGSRVYVRLEATTQYVHAQAVRSGSSHDGVCHGVAGLVQEPLPDRNGAAAAGDAVRRFAVAQIASRLGVDAAELRVGREGRVPVLFRGGRRLPGTLSLSHHGRFVAFAWRAAAPA